MAAPLGGLAQQSKPQPKQPQPASQTKQQQPPTATPQPQPVQVFNPRSARRITAEEVKLRTEAGEKVVVVDTRSKFTGPKVKDAVNATVDKVAAWAKNLPKDTFIITYCTCPNEHSSAAAVLKLQEVGFTNAFALQGGLSAWTLAMLPTEPARPMNGQ